MRLVISLEIVVLLNVVLLLFLTVNKNRSIESIHVIRVVQKSSLFIELVPTVL